METLEQEWKRLGRLVQACEETPAQGLRFDEIGERLSEVRGCFICADAGDGSRCLDCIADDPGDFEPGDF